MIRYQPKAPQADCTCYADMESRIKHCMARRPEDENLTEAQMRKQITEIDRSRAKYYAFFSEQK